MPPQLTHRIVQYSAPARPPITRSTRSWPSQSGQLERTSAGEFALDSYMSHPPLLLRHHRTTVEEIDAGLGVRDRGLRVGPGEADLELGKRNAVDDDGLGVLAPDSGVPKPLAEFKSVDLKAVIGHVRIPPIWIRIKPRAAPDACELVHTFGRSSTCRLRKPI